MTSSFSSPSFPLPFPFFFFGSGSRSPASRGLWPPYPLAPRPIERRPSFPSSFPYPSSSSAPVLAHGPPKLRNPRPPYLPSSSVDRAAAFFPFPLTPSSSSAPRWFAVSKAWKSSTSLSSSSSVDRAAAFFPSSFPYPSSSAPALAHGPPKLRNPRLPYPLAPRPIERRPSSPSSFPLPFFFGSGSRVSSVSEASASWPLAPRSIERRPSSPSSFPFPFFFGSRISRSFVSASSTARAFEMISLRSHSLGGLLTSTVLSW